MSRYALTKVITDMVEVNIVAGGSLASLLSLEAERMGVTYKVTATPIKNALVYIADLTLVNEKKLDREKNGGNQLGTGRVSVFIAVAVFAFRAEKTCKRTACQRCA